MAIAENLRHVKERIARAAERSGRHADEIKLVAVTKYVDPAEAFALHEAGCEDLGESRPQELWRKAEAFSAISPRPMVRWHLIGHLQRNKIRRTLPLVDLIHGVDSERLLAAIDAEWSKSPAGPSQAPPELGETLPIRVLLEVNTSGEAAKHGLAPADVEGVLMGAAKYPHVRIRGLMTMAALDVRSDVIAGSFATLRQLRDRLRSVAPECVSLDELSMGMSSDFEIAIAEGATIVRVGSLLWEDS